MFLTFEGQLMTKSSVSSRMTRRTAPLIALLGSAGLVLTACGGVTVDTSALASLAASAMASSSAQSEMATEEVPEEAASEEALAVCDGDTVPCAVGDLTSNGGTVFYVSETPFPCGDGYECTVMEAAPLGWYGTDVDPNPYWCSDDQPGSDADLGTRTAFGTGWDNTAALVTACSLESAAGMATSYDGGGMTDWFLPSKDELDTMMSASVVLFSSDQPATSEWYWSSSESDSINAWNQSFNTGSQEANKRFISLAVRPVRAF